jgi:nucleoside-diphosphate-sugar epimerase
MNLPVLSLRLGTAYGTSMRANSVFSIFIDRDRQREAILVQGTGAQSRQFTHASDIGRAFALGVESELHGMTINVVAEQSISILQLANMISERLPTIIAHTVARPGEICSAVVDCKKARRLLGWTAEVPFEEGLNDLIWHVTATPRKTNDLQGV